MKLGDPERCQNQSCCISSTYFIFQYFDLDIKQRAYIHISHILHEGADKCEREYCMFKHDYLEDVEIVESLVAKDSIWNVVDESELNDGDKKNDDDNL